MADFSRLPLVRWFTPSDEEAMAKVQAFADEGAFGRLVDRWQAPIERLCTRMTGDLHLAQDLTQETFVRVFVRRVEYQPGRRFSTWLWRIALNLSYDALRARRRRSAPPEGEPDFEVLSSDSAAESPWPGPDAAAIQEETAQLVRAALLRLPESLRAVLILRHYENLRFREIAEVLDVPEGTVKSRLSEALSRLERMLRPALGGHPAKPGTTPLPLVPL